MHDTAPGAYTGPEWAIPSSLVAAVFSLPVGLENTFLGNFGEDWFRTICAVAGCDTYSPRSDLLGTDFIVQHPNGELIRAQVKTTVGGTLIGDAYHFALDVPTYDHLREGTGAGYLLLAVVHEAHPRWTGHCHRGSLVRAAIYWVRVAGMAPTQNAVSVTLLLPLANMLTPAGLRGLFT